MIPVSWLAHAELQTCSRLPLVLPRTIYLSHQFSFYALSDDYHALIRRYHFDLHANRIEVRKEVQASAYSAADDSDGFLDNSPGSHGRHHRLGVSSSFDEPLSSAITSDLSALMASSPPVIPMYPNGRVGSGQFRAPLPVNRMAAGLSEGMSEGLGRLRREIGKVRSPRMVATTSRTKGIAGSAGDEGGRASALEFDEEDEDFMLARDPALSSLTSHDDESMMMRDEGESQSAPSVSTPSTGIISRATRREGEGRGREDDELGDDTDSAWMEWEVEDQRVLEDAEQFQEISVVGFMDEEQEQQARQVRVKGTSSRKGSGKRRM